MRQFLLNDPVANIEHEGADWAIRQRLEKFLPDRIPRRLAVAFRPFVEDVPWRYWSNPNMASAVGLLENDANRTVQAISIRRSSLSRGFENLFRPAQISLHERELDHNKPSDLVRISTEALPEYLRLAEHVFGNLIEFYWSVSKRGGVEGRFDLRGGIDYLSQHGMASLVDGYSDRVRNAIAHGEVEFSFPDIRFGQPHFDQYSSSEFFRLFDTLTRTTNLLALAIMLFWVKHDVGPILGTAIPTAIVTRFAAGGANRRGLKILGAVESELPRTGRQLHVAVQMFDRGRTVVLANAARVAAHFIEAGAREYDRLLVGVDHGASIQSLVIILPRKLQAFFAENASLESLKDIFDETQLLWFDEHPMKTRIRNWSLIAQSAVAQARQATYKNWQAAGLRVGMGRFMIRDIQNVSSQGIARVRIIGVLVNPEDANNRALIKEIVHELVRAGRRRFVRSRGSVLEKGIPWPRRPSYVFIDLYKEDGPIRWLRSGGWPAGNLIAVGERVWHRRKPVHVTNPEEKYKRISLRFKMDEIAVAQAASQLSQLSADLNLS